MHGSIPWSSRVALAAFPLLEGCPTTSRMSPPFSPSRFSHAFLFGLAKWGIACTRLGLRSAMWGLDLAYQVPGSKHTVAECLAVPGFSSRAFAANNSTIPWYVYPSHESSSNKMHTALYPFDEIRNKCHSRRAACEEVISAGIIRVAMVDSVWKRCITALINYYTLPP